MLSQFLCMQVKTMRRFLKVKLQLLGSVNPETDGVMESEPFHRDEHLKKNSLRQSALTMKWEIQCLF